MDTGICRSLYQIRRTQGIDMDSASSGTLSTDKYYYHRRAEELLQLLTSTHCSHDSRDSLYYENR